MSGLVQGASERAEVLAEHASRTGERALVRAQSEAHRLESGIQNALRDNPLAIGAIAFACGAGAGLALPRTRTEDEWLGAGKDELLSRAEGAARKAIGTVEGKVEALTGGEAQRTMGEDEMIGKNTTALEGLSAGMPSPPLERL